MHVTSFTTDDRYQHVTITHTDEVTRLADHLGWAIVETDQGDTYLEPVALIEGQPVTETEYGTQWSTGATWRVS